MKISSITTTALRAEVSEEQLEALDKKVTDFVPAQNKSKGCNLWKHMLPLVPELFLPRLRTSPTNILTSNLCTWSLV